RRHRVLPRRRLHRPGVPRRLPLRGDGPGRGVPQLGPAAPDRRGVVLDPPAVPALTGCSHIGPDGTVPAPDEPGRGQMCEAGPVRQAALRWWSCSATGTGLGLPDLPALCLPLTIDVS